MGQRSETAIALAHKAATNSQVAVDMAENTNNKLVTRIVKLEMLITQLTQQVDLLQHKYDLMLTENFSGGSTTHGDKC